MPSSLMLLTYPHRPDPRVFRESRALVRHGREIHLIAWDREGGLPKEADESGVHVLRVGPRCPYRSAGKVITRLPLFWFNALRKSRKLEFDTIHCHDFDTLPLGLALSKLRSRPVLYDAHEIYSGMIRKDMPGIADIVWRVEKWMSEKADEVITVNESLANILSKGRKDQVRIVMNSPDPDTLDGADAAEIRKRHGLKGFVISYLGSLEPGRFVKELVESIEPSGKIELAIGGNGTMASIAEEGARSNSSIKFLGTLDTDEALKVTWASDVVIAMLDPSNPNYKASTPVKVLDAMACGRPVITSKGLDISKTVQEVGCGFVIPYDKDAFKETLKKALADPKTLDEMGRKGKEYFARELSWERSQDALFRAYRALESRK
jgi:glycosyltransferase involved in cell wall biosynthesis